MRCCIKVKSACIAGGYFLFVFVLLSASVKAPVLVHGGFFFFITLIGSEAVKRKRFFLICINVT